MIDRYSLEKIIDGHWAEAAKAAARDRLASHAAIGAATNSGRPLRYFADCISTPESVVRADLASTAPTVWRFTKSK